MVPLSDVRVRCGVVLPEISLRLPLMDAWLASQIPEATKSGKMLTRMDDWRNVKCQFGTTAGTKTDLFSEIVLA